MVAAIAEAGKVKYYNDVMIKIRHMKKCRKRPRIGQQSNTTDMAVFQTAWPGSKERHALFYVQKNMLERAVDKRAR